MKKFRTKWFLFILAFSMVMTIGTPLAVVSAESSDALPCDMWVEPSDANGIPARIDVFKAEDGGASKDSGYTYQLYLPDNAHAEACFLFWMGDMRITVDGRTYDSGECPVPPADTEKVCTFKNGESEQGSFSIRTYQGSEAVTPVFIDIDEGRGTIEEMDRDTRHRKTCSGRINVDGQWHDMPKIKGRGNLSWTLAKDKKSYNVTLDSKITINGIDSPKSKKWSLLSEVIDHSLLRNRAGFRLAHELGIGHDTSSADVWMNGEYQGCYTLTPKNDSFVNKKGYMIEQDNYKEDLPVEAGGDPQFTLSGLGTSEQKDIITVKKIGDDLLEKDGEVDESPENQKAVAESIRIWLQDAWDAVRSDDGYNSKGRYYTEYIDIESFARMYLVQEYVKSLDVCAGSLFFHRDGMTDEDKLIAGPVWDLDIALGARSKPGYLTDLSLGRGALITEIDERKSSLYRTLGRHEDFMEEVRTQYDANRAVFDDLERNVADMAGQIRDSAMMNHIKVRDILGGNYHKYNTETVSGQGTEYEQRMLATTDSRTDWPNYVENLKTFIRVRALWFSRTDFKPCVHRQTEVTEKATLTDIGSITKTCEICGKREVKAIYAPEKFRLSPASYVYNGRDRKPAVTVTDSSGKSIPAANYRVVYSNNKNAGKASATITFRGDHYSGSKVLSYIIRKAENPMKIKAGAALIRYSKLKKKARSLKINKVLSFVRKGKGTKTYNLTGVKKTKAKKYFKVNRRTGKVTVKKGLEKGTYKIRIKVRASGDGNYRAKVKTVIIKINIK